MSNGARMIQTLRDHRPLLLACEAIGWLHMAGKAHPDFLRQHGGAGVSYEEKKWHEQLNPAWSDQLDWLRGFDAFEWPDSLVEFVTKHAKGGSVENLVGCLQAGHAMASGIEKNIPRDTSRYLEQDANHMWLATAFGHPVRNLLANQPEVLRPGGWQELLQQIGALLDELKKLGTNPPAGVQPWWSWREEAIGERGWLRHAFESTLAETRLPNNDVTLWDQSYVASALFKSAVAGLVLLQSAARDAWTSLKYETRWRVLTIGFGTDHYEARAIRIGDWAGARMELAGFFEDVRRLVEVDLAVGSLLYRDDQVLVFTFPGQRFDDEKDSKNRSLSDDDAKILRQWIAERIDKLAENHKFEIPALCDLSCSTRSFIPMARIAAGARDRLAIPLHRPWQIPDTADQEGHVCPVCLVRFNEPPASAKTDNVRKSYPCPVCRERRRGRLDAWLAGEPDTIWIDEVADGNDRIALLTLSLDIEPWLEGKHVDSLRAQSIAEWRRFNPVLSGQNNPMDPAKPFFSMHDYIHSKLGFFDKNDPVLLSLQEGYRHEDDWKDFYKKIVEDRADAPGWKNLDNSSRAGWLAHQLFRKLASPGRVHRFWRNAESFFDELLLQFREIASTHPNRWRTRRLLLKPDQNHLANNWEDRETYSGHWRGVPFDVIYHEKWEGFFTIGNLARCFLPEETDQALVQETKQESIKVKGDDGVERELRVKSVCVPEKIGTYAPVIPLDLSPRRFRVLVPLDRATACIESAIAKWREDFARVWDRMPLRIGVVAFPRLTPFQAVIEAARNLEDALTRNPEETWRVVECRTRQGVTALSLEHKDSLYVHGGRRELVVVPTQLPDGREDVFYPYVQVEERELRSPRDFQHPEGHVYRHMADLRAGDGVVVHPSRIAAVFLDTTARRFEPAAVRPIGDFERMREVWELLVRSCPSLSVLRGAWFELQEHSRNWRDPEERWLPGAETEWLDLARAILNDRLGLSGAALETIVEAAGQGTLEWALVWHLTWLKEGLGLEGAEQ